MGRLKIVIITEGGKAIGLGHVTRCLALCQSFEEKGYLPRLIVNGDKRIAGSLKGSCYLVFNWLKQRKRLIKEAEGSDVAIVDSYLAERSFYSLISKMSKVPVYMDDNMRLAYPEGVVINGSINAKYLRYPKSEKIVYLLGSRYIPIRREFWDVREKAISEDVRNIIITFGGADPGRITMSVVDFLRRKLPQIKKTVVLGNWFKDTRRIKVLSDKNTYFAHHPNAAQFRELMFESDIAISAGGQTLYELARVGVPSIAVATTDNQLNNIAGARDSGFIEYAGAFKDRGFFERMSEAIDRMADGRVRSKMSAAGRRCIDGKGASRVRDFLSHFIFK